MSKELQTKIEPETIRVDFVKDGSPVDPENEYNKLEFKAACTLLEILLERNWIGIQRAVHECPEERTSVSISLKLNHTSAEGRYLKAKLSYAVKTKSESDEIFVGHPDQLKML